MATILLGFVAVFSIAGCSQLGVQTAADEDAAYFADHHLLQMLVEAAGSAPAGERLAAVERQLQSPDRQFLSSFPNMSWVVGDERQSRVPVTVWAYWEDKSFSAAQAWGTACREYVLTEPVTVRSVECPDDTAEFPSVGAVGWDSL